MMDDLLHYAVPRANYTLRKLHPRNQLFTPQRMTTQSGELSAPLLEKKPLIWMKMLLRGKSLRFLVVGEAYDSRAHEGR